MENLEGLSWKQPPEASLDDPAAALSRAHTFSFIHLVTLGGVARYLRGQVFLTGLTKADFLSFIAKGLLRFANAESRRKRLRQHLEPSKVLP